MQLPYLTSEIPGIGGNIKETPEDFFVEEIPLYEPSGEGEHVYCQIEKTGLTTFDVVNRIAFALNVPRQNIGYAGMKDANAVTRQMLSIQGVSEQQVEALDIQNVVIRSVARHGNKMRLGHLRGNRFVVRIRNVDAGDVVKVQPVVDAIAKHGMPNFFGEQRFGTRHNNDLLGAALIRDDTMGVLKLLLGTPDHKYDNAQTIHARKLFDEHKNEESMHAWPRHCGMERRTLHRLIKTHKPSAAVRFIDEPIKRLWISALQSRVFNEVLSRRIKTMDRLLDGDFAWKHDNGACFPVPSAEVEQARCASFEISPTGPLVGYRMSTPEGQPLVLEQEVLGQFNLTPEQFRLEGKHKVKGARRPLRVQVQDLQLSGGVDDHGAHVTLAFTLPAGAFATVLLGEVMKGDMVEAVEATAPSGETPEP